MFSSIFFFSRTNIVTHWRFFFWLGLTFTSFRWKLQRSTNWDKKAFNSNFTIHKTSKWMLPKMIQFNCVVCFIQTVLIADKISLSRSRQKGDVFPPSFLMNVLKLLSTECSYFNWTALTQKIVAKRETVSFFSVFL